MSVRPIPRTLLCDSASVEEPDASDRRGDSYLPARTIGHVRFEPDVAKVDREWAEDDSVSGVLFVDATNSDGAFAPATRSRVTVAGFTGTVRHVKTLRGLGPEAHHWEVALG